MSYLAGEAAGYVILLDQWGYHFGSLENNSTSHEMSRVRFPSLEDLFHKFPSIHEKKILDQDLDGLY